MLALNLARIRTPHERFEQTYAPGQLESTDDFRVIEPVSLAFDISKDNQQFRLVGTVRTTAPVHRRFFFK